MKTGFSLLEILHRENPVLIARMGLQCRVEHWHWADRLHFGCSSALRALAKTFFMSKDTGHIHKNSDSKKAVTHLTL